jgi:hypothetical protein
MTAGGLFSNYELSSIASGYTKTTNSEYKVLEDIFSSYSDVNNPCCVEATNEFIELLLDNKYIKKENELAKERIHNKNNSIRSTSKSPLFGNESFKAPSIHNPSPNNNTNPTIPNISTEIIEQDFLIRHVPKAGGRSKQVHFNLDILKNYFKLLPGENIHLQQLHDIYSPNHIEYRSIVYSERNKNVKIEVEGAQILDTQYPTNEKKRPILVLKRINATFFEYMLLLDGNPGYNQLNEYLLTLQVKKTLPYKILSDQDLLSLWDACPLI